jgi:uncharacterized membrane protein YhiD involved in acid resistance
LHNDADEVFMNTNQFSPPLLKMIDLNAYDVFAGMILAFLLCAFLSRLLRISPANAASDKNLAKTMIFLGAIVSLIMAVIGNSLARAFGAIGALSLIRFRTAVKSTNDLAYLFMSIAVGMACGSGYFAIATGAAALFAIFIVLVERFMPDAPMTRVAMLRVAYPLKSELSGKIVEKIESSVLNHRLLSEENLADSKYSEMLIEVTLKEESQSSLLIKQICDIDADIKASVLLD